MKQKKVVVEIEGTSPLLMNRFADKAIEGTSKRRTGAMVEDEIKDKLYLFDDLPNLPAVYLRNAIVEASKQFKITGKGKSTYSKIVGSTVDVVPEFSEIKGGYIPFRIAAVNPMTKGRMMVTRPRFDNWSVAFEIVLNDDGVPLSVVNEILEHAGKYVGVGDWRPDKKGMFGKFMITSFKEVK
jgi:hypothetical protein